MKKITKTNNFNDEFDKNFDCNDYDDSHQNFDCKSEFDMSWSFKYLDKKA